MRAIVAFIFAAAVLMPTAKLMPVATAAGLPGPAVWPVRIEISAWDAATLGVKPREYVRANVRILDATYPNVAIRLKGRGTFQGLNEKPSFTLNFDRFGGGAGPEKLSKIHLNNSAEDASYLKERIGSELFEASGIAVPRVGHARVTLNGRMLGLYVLKEGSTKEFIERHFKDPGNLYDTDEGGDVDQKMDLEIAGSGSDQDELKRLAAAAKDPELARRWTRLGMALDVDEVITFIAMEMMICHWDGYSLSGNNFRVYYDGVRDKVSFLPAGMDQIFSKPDFTWKPQMAGLVARAIMETPEGQARYDRKFRELFEKHFRTDPLTNRVNDILSGLESFLEKSEFRSMQVEGQLLCERIAQREKSLREQLAARQPSIPEFVNGSVALEGWKPFDLPDGGRMVEDEARLTIAAGLKTAASWRTTVRLMPGRYAFTGKVQTVDAKSLPFGARQGAALRVMGTTAQSAHLTGTSEVTVLKCEFEVEEEREVVLACEFRAAGGEARFEKDLRLEKLQ